METDSSGNSGGNFIYVLEILNVQKNEIFF